MEKEIKEMLQEILDNQAVLYRKLDILQSKLVDGVSKTFYTVDRATADMAKDRQNLQR